MSSPLRPGSRVAVVAPAGPVPAADFAAGIKLLSGRYDIVLGAQAPGADATLPYLAASDDERAGALNRALRDERVEAIFFARGGYGCTRILENLDGETLARRRLPMVGFSDITAIHAWAANLGVPTVHGPTVTQLHKLPGQDIAALFQLLEGGGAPALSGLDSLAGGRASGPLWGGNLTVLSHLCGTPNMPDLTGKVLLLEDVNEATYRVDRALTHLRQAGALGAVAAVLVGDLTGCEDPRMESPRGMLEDRLGDLGVPVLLGVPVGHGERNLALPLGWTAEVDGGRGELGFA